MTRPPGALLLAITIGAGLLTGLSRFGEPAIVIPILLAAGWVVRRHWWWPALPGLALGMLVGAHAVATAARSCAARLPPGQGSYHLKLIDPGAGSGRTTIRALDCDGEVIARWLQGMDEPAGALLDVEARWIPRLGVLGRPEGLLVVTRATKSADGVRAQFTFVDRLRTFLARSSRELYGSRAPFVDALVTGRRGELDPDLKAAFTASGLVHLLAISGFHIGLLFAWVLLGLRICRVPRHRAECIAAIAAVGYAALLGWPAPAARAAVLVVLYSWCRWRQRQPRSSALLALSVVPLLICFPWCITEIGAWLSIVALAGLTVATRWSDRAISESGWVRALTASIGASLSTAPLTALAFGQVAPIAVLLGLIAGPLAAIVQPAIMASLLLSSVAPDLAKSFAASSGILLQAFEAIVRWGAIAPGAALVGTTGVAAAWPWLLALIAALWAIHGRSTRQVASQRVAVSGTAALWFTLLLSLGDHPSLGPHEMGLFFVDVGQGDAALIRTPGGHWVAIDAGPASDRWDAGKRIVAPLLRSMGAQRLELLVISHAHRDHLGGAGALIDAMPVGVVLDPAEPFLDQGYLAWLGDVAQHHVRWRVAQAGEQWSIDDVEFRVLHPPRSWAHRGEDLNEDSIVLEVRYGDFVALLTGDAGIAAESRFALELTHVDILKVGHHGSRSATSDLLLDQILPTVAVVSVGQNNYGHPSPEALGRLQRAQVEVWRTDQQGTITVRTDGHGINVQGAGRSTTFTATGSAPRRRRA